MPEITLYHAPQTRSFRTLWFLEELGAPYTLEPIDLERGEQKSPAHLARHPMGKVPLVEVDGLPVWETPAIFAHLSDLHPQAGLAPEIGTPERAEYYRWLSFGTAVMEPAFMDMMKGHEVNPVQAAWGDFATMKTALAQGLRAGDWLVGDAFSGADVLVGANLNWFATWAAKAFADLDGLAAYLERLRARDAFARATQIDVDVATRLKAE